MLKDAIGYTSPIVADAQNFTILVPTAARSKAAVCIVMWDLTTSTEYKYNIAADARN